nr:GatB/YqeY domain-containing protein [Neptunicoccus sediminis]
MDAMRDRINAKVKQAMRDKDSEQLGTLRLINAAIKDRDIAARSEGNHDGVSDEEILKVLARMIKQRRESAKAYEEGGRLELAEKEINEISIIEQFLPKQLSDEELQVAVKKAISETGAESIRDMGRVMGVLKTNYTGQMDFGKAGGTVKEMLSC